MIKAIFIDRDGTLLDEPEDGVIDTWEQFKILDGVASLIKLQAAGYKLMIITNQDAINAGKLDKDFYDETSAKLLEALQKHAVHIEKIYTCPHTVTENCNCRKPKTGLIEQAEKDFQIDREKSWVIGDRTSDVKMAQACNMQSVFIKSDLHTLGDAQPDFVAKNLREAVEFIAKHP